MVGREWGFYKPTGLNLVGRIDFFEIDGRIFSL